jgi:hypothetical protein
VPATSGPVPTVQSAHLGETRTRQLRETLAALCEITDLGSGQPPEADMLRTSM